MKPGPIKAGIRDGKGQKHRALLASIALRLHLVCLGIAGLTAVRGPGHEAEEELQMTSMGPTRVGGKEQWGYSQQVLPQAER